MELELELETLESSLHLFRHREKYYFIDSLGLVLFSFKVLALSFQGSV